MKRGKNSGICSVFPSTLYCECSDPFFKRFEFSTYEILWISRMTGFRASRQALVICRPARLHAVPHTTQCFDGRLDHPNAIARQKYDTMTSLFAPDACNRGPNDVIGRASWSESISPWQLAPSSRAALCVLLGRPRKDNIASP
jgi:hypothetical protein